MERLWPPCQMTLGLSHGKWSGGVKRMMSTVIVFKVHWTPSHTTSDHLLPPSHTSVTWGTGHSWFYCQTPSPSIGLGNQVEISITLLIRMRRTKIQMGERLKQKPTLSVLIKCWATRTAAPCHRFDNPCWRMQNIFPHLVF